MKRIYYLSNILLIVLLVACSKVSGEKLLESKTIAIPDNLKEQLKEATATWVSDTLAVGDTYVEIKAKILTKGDLKFITEAQINQLKNTGIEITGAFQKVPLTKIENVDGQILFYKEKLGSKDSKVRYFTITPEGKIIKDHNYKE